MRRSKTLQQQAKCYEVANEVEMMDLMLASWTNGNFSCFKELFKELNTENSEFYDMIDFLLF